MRRSRVTVAATLAFGAALLAWTLLPPSTVDGLWPYSPVASTSLIGHAAATLALLTSPVIIYPALLAAAWWASRRRFTAMSQAILVAVALAVLSTALLKVTVARDRPESPWDFLVSIDPLSYPSAHTTAATVAAMLAGVLTTTTRRPRRTVLLTRLLGVVAVVMVAVGRLLLGAHYVSDVGGGFLLGGLVVSVSCLAANVHMLPPQPARTGPGRLVVVYNPTRVRDLDAVHRLVTHETTARGWESPVWLATTAEDPGGGMARAAVESSADLVLVIGGDGTVRDVCAGLAGAGVPVAILPSGTGNLLARNLGVPLDAGRALAVAFTGTPTATGPPRVTPSPTAGAPASRRSWSDSAPTRPCCTTPTRRSSAPSGRRPTCGPGAATSGPAPCRSGSPSTTATRSNATRRSWRSATSVTSTRGSPVMPAASRARRHPGGADRLPADGGRRRRG